MILNKRASSGYPTFIVVAGLIALTACWLILLNKGGTFDKSIGESQFMLISAYQQGENYLMFMDQAGKYSADQAIMDLASGGGYSAEPSCGAIGGYVLWDTKLQDCYPEESTLEASFGQRFNRLLDSYSAIYLGDTAGLDYSLEFAEQEPLTIIARPNRATDILIYPNGSTAMVLGGSIDYAAIGAGLPAKAPLGTGMLPGEEEQAAPSKSPGKSASIDETGTIAESAMASKLEFGLPLGNAVLNSLYSGNGYHLEACFGASNHLLSFPVAQETPILAIADGVVHEVMNADDGNGLTLIIAHNMTPEGKPAARLYSVYYHLSQSEHAAGEQVKLGEQVGLSGTQLGRPLFEFELRAQEDLPDDAINPVCIAAEFGLLHSAEPGLPACAASPCDLKGGKLAGELI
jgi:hypothetical protein